MKYSEFCQPFYSKTKSLCALTGITSQRAIALFFLETALRESASSVLAFGDSLFIKWFSGDRSPDPMIWDRTIREFDEDDFSRKLISKLNEAVLSELIDAFELRTTAGLVPDKYALAAAITLQFKAIAAGNGEAENNMAEHYASVLNVTEFPKYIERSYAKYSKLKTLLYRDAERPFDEFFVCNYLDCFDVPSYKKKRNSPDIIENVTAGKLLERARYSLLVGMGGIGKSMMMRHLFLSSINESKKTKLIPILVTLREFGADNDSLFEIIVDSVHRFDITFSAAHVQKLMSEGKCQLFLDGLDEIKTSDMTSFQRQLDVLIDRYPTNQYVMSSRRISSFVELPRFSVFWMQPFTLEQALELVDKLDYCSEEPRLKEQFKINLQEEYISTHEEFVTNPLLLTLMLMNYRRFSDVPEKKYLFYEQAYDTLLTRHDSDKIAYKRVFHSVTDPSDFTLAFREFCAKSYRKGDYEFDKKKFDEYFSKLKVVERLNPELMKADNFLYDICHSACLMYEEGQSYHFLHRSFQEYFFADYYSRQDNETLRKLGDYIAKKRLQSFDDFEAFDMLYDLDPNKTERFIILPFLASIFEADVNGKNYWLFLSKGFSAWVYRMLDDDVIEDYRRSHDIRGHYPRFMDSLEPTSIIMSLVFRILRMIPFIRIGALDDRFKYRELVVETIYGEVFGKKHHTIVPLLQIPNKLLNDEQGMERSGLKDRIARDDDGNPVEFGHVYCFNFIMAMKEPEKFKPFVDMWDREGFEAKNAYYRVKAYYNVLKDKYENGDVEDDDDF